MKNHEYRERTQKTAGKEVKQLSTETERQRRELADKIKAEKAAAEEKRKEENRKYQAALKSAKPTSQRPAGAPGAVATSRRGSMASNIGVNSGGLGKTASVPVSGDGKAASAPRDPGSPTPGPSARRPFGKRPNASDESLIARSLAERADLTRTSVSPRTRASSDELNEDAEVAGALPARSGLASSLGNTRGAPAAGSGGGGGGLSVPLSARERAPSPLRFREGDEPPAWRKVELIGKGANGKVYSAMLLSTGGMIAVKQYRLKDEGLDVQAMRNFEMEIEVMKDLCHPNIVQYLGSEFRPVDGVNDEEFNIFLEYIPGNSLETLLAKTGPLEESVARIYMRQILEGCSYLHANGIIHRDIKCANILISTGGDIKLTDFGTAKRVNDNTLNGCKTFSGTPFWMAPEVIRNEDYGRKADVWSIGCTLIEMVTAKHPWWPLENAFAVMFHVTNTEEQPAIPAEIKLSADCKDFLRLCLERDTSKRPTVDDLLDHPFVAVSDAFEV